MNKFTRFYWLIIVEKLQKRVNFIDFMFAVKWAQTVPIPPIHILLVTIPPIHILLTLPKLFGNIYKWRQIYK